MESCESFQPWLARPLLGLAVIFDEAVAVAVAVFVDPAQRGLDVRPDLGQGLAIAGALEIHAGEHEEERRRVDRAVVAAERHLAEVGHLAVTALVQDLARLGVRLGSNSVAWVAASVRSTPRATDGSIHSINMAVMMPSRPKTVLYQGMPA